MIYETLDGARRKRKKPRARKRKRKTEQQTARQRVSDAAARVVEKLIEPAAEAVTEELIPTAPETIEPEEPESIEPTEPAPEEPETAGLFGPSWQEKIAAAMGIKYKPADKTKVTGYIDKLHKAYMTAIEKQKYKPSDTNGISGYMSSVTTESGSTINSFINQLKRLASTGQISYTLYDPGEKTAKKLFSFGSGIINKAIIAGAVIGGAYLILPQIIKPGARANG